MTSDGINAGAHRARRRRHQAVAGARSRERCSPASRRPDESFRAAAEAAFADARPREGNRYKVELGKRTLVRALAASRRDEGVKWSHANTMNVALGAPVARARRPPESHRRRALRLRHGRRQRRPTPFSPPARSRAAGSSRSTTSKTRAMPGVLDVITYREVARRDQARRFLLQGRLCRLDHPAARLRQSDASRPDRRRRARREFRGGARRRASRSTQLRRGERPRRASTAPAPRPSPPRTRRPSMRTRRSATPTRPSKPPRSRSTRAIRRRPSIIIPSSSSRRCAPGTAASSRSGNPRRTSRASSTDSPSSSGSPRRTSASSRPIVGGAFGSRGSLTQRTALIAFAAKRLGRPVKLVATRDQGFTIATYRAETRQRVRLGASRDGKLQSLIHEGWEVTSRPGQLHGRGHRRDDAALRLPERRLRRSRSSMPIAARPASCARRRSCLICSASKARWTNSRSR